MNFLLLDFGTSRVKSAILKNGNHALSDFSEWTPILPTVDKDNKFEVSVHALKNLFESIVTQYRRSFDLSGIFLCTEMHGFALLDEKNNPISNYISWQDGRENTSQKKKLPDFLKKFPEKNYLEITGMMPAASPVASLLHVLSDITKKNVKIVTMPELFATDFGKSNSVAHISSSAALGLWDYHNKCWSNAIIEYLEQYTGHKLLFNRVSDDFETAGVCQGIPVYCGMGDLQCAVIGARNSEKSISINLGTGSQVSQIGGNGTGFEYRPIFHNTIMKTVTHIPSGRVLNNFIGFLHEIAPNRNFWTESTNLSSEKITSATLDFDLALFNGAWGYSGAGSIRNIREKSLTVENFLASLLKSYTSQYVKVINSFEISSVEKLIFSGGIANRIPSVREIISSQTGIPAITSGVAEETLEGLKILITNNFLTQ